MAIEPINNSKNKLNNKGHVNECRTALVKNPF